MELDHQYGDGLLILWLNFYWDNTDQRVLFGSATEADANTIIPTSGDHDTIFNAKLNNNDLNIGNTANKNIMFTYDGKLGLNILSDYLLKHYCMSLILHVLKLLE